MNTYRALVNISGRYTEIFVQAKTMIDARNNLHALYGRDAIKNGPYKV